MVLFHLEGLSYDEIATKLRLSSQGNDGYFSSQEALRKNWGRAFSWCCTTLI